MTVASASPTPLAVLVPDVARALSATSTRPDCTLLAVVSPPDPGAPPLAPPAASTPVALITPKLLPICPVAFAAPVVAEATPVFEMVLVFDSSTLTELLPPFLAAPVAKLPSLLLVMAVTATTPEAVAEPLAASALWRMMAVPLWLLLALVLPEPLPPAPPAASTLPTEMPSTLSPLWPVAVADPVTAVAWPLLVTVVVWVLVSVKELSPPWSAAPVAKLPVMLLLTLVTATTPVAVAAPLCAAAESFTWL